MKIIGIGGLARSGKDTFVGITKEILLSNNLRIKQYSFAENVKVELADFLKSMCGIDVWTTDNDIKKDIRPLLVWYATWWRKQDPMHWVKCVERSIDNDLGNYDVAIISDVRYPNECRWIHNKNGRVVHIKRYTLDQTCKKYDIAPNEEEAYNDPLVQEMVDLHMEWESKNLPPAESLNDVDLKGKVLNILNDSRIFNGILSQ